MCDQLPPELEVQFVAALRSAEQHSLDCKLATAAGFAGCHVAHICKEKIHKVWQKRYGIAIQQEDVAIAEKMDWKRNFLCFQFDDVGFVARDVADLTQHSPFNAKIGKESLMPWFCDFEGGFTCVSRSSFNSNAPQNLNCVQKGTEKTGKAYALCDNIADLPQVKKLLLENLSALGQKDKSTDGSQSDTEYIVDQLKSKGFCAWACTSNANEFGSPVPRIRTYWLACRLEDKGNNDAAIQFAISLSTAFKLPHSTDASSFITKDDWARQAEADKLGFPTLFNEQSVRLPKRQKADLDWKFQHKEAFEEVGMFWPVDLSSVYYDCPEVNTSGMLQREVEVAVFMHKVFAPPGEDVFEFCDGNQSLTRLIANAFDENGHVRQSPWILNQPGTLVGSMQVFVRWTYQVEKNGYRESKVRCLEGMEYMRLFGWADSDWKPFRWKQVWDDAFDHTEGLANMVGNAFSGFQYAAHYMALMATWGRFGQHAGNQSLPLTSTSVEARPQQSGSESDETGSSYTSGSSN